MFTPRQLALSVFVAAALSTPGFAQQGAGSASDKPAASAKSPSSTDSRTTTQAQRSTNKERSAKNENDKELHRGDRKFVENVSRANMAEIELGKIAANKASNEEVKRFAQHMVDDHGKAGDELKSAVQDNGVKMPTDLDRSHKRLADDLNKRTGEDFDRKYMSEMVRDHEKTLKLLQDEARKGDDPQLKAFAEKTAQSVQEHLDQARKIADNIGATRGGRSSANKNAARSSPSANTGASSSRTQKDQPATPGR